MRRCIHGCLRRPMPFTTQKGTRYEKCRYSSFFKLMKPSTWRTILGFYCTRMTGSVDSLSQNIFLINFKSMSSQILCTLFFLRHWRMRITVQVRLLYVNIYCMFSLTHSLSLTSPTQKCRQLVTAIIILFLFATYGNISVQYYWHIDYGKFGPVYSSVLLSSF